MKYVDYREKLGLGFNDADKTEMLFNKVIGFLTRANIDYSLRTSIWGDKDIAYSFCQAVGEACCYDDLRDIIISIEKENCIPGIISKFIVAINLGTRKGAEALIDLLKNYIESLSIAYELYEDEDGYFIFPKGAKELDDALVSEPLEWLKGYPDAHKAFIKALKAYSKVTEENASDTADLFRKALETFFQEFFGGSRSLEKYVEERTYEKYLDAQGIPSDLRGEFENTVKMYSKFINNNAKHHDKTSKNILEFIMYQTGNIIRLLITLKKEENNG